MQKTNYYIVEKNVNKVLKGEYTNFLDPHTYKLVTSKLKNIKYNVYYPYKDSEKIIIYTNEMPSIKLLEIISYEKLTHRDIMGSLYGLNIDSSLFGDIIVTNNHYYIMVIDSIANYIINEYNMVGKYHVKLKEVTLDILSNYTREYETVEVIVSSLRIDNVISTIIGNSREQIKKKFIDDEVIVNYEFCHKNNYKLNEGDIFSIRKIGKFKYTGIIKNTKKGNYLIKCLKYIDN